MATATILLIICMIIIAIVQIVVLIKFFQMAKDIRALKQYFIDCYKFESNDVGFKRETYYKDLLGSISKEDWDNIHQLPTEIKSTQTHIND